MGEERKRTRRDFIGQSALLTSALGAATSEQGADRDAVAQGLPAKWYTRFGKHKISRLIVGGNPLCGNSHYSDKWDDEMRSYFTTDRVVETLRRCESSGINTFQGRADYHRVLYWLEMFRRKGGQLQWIAQTASEMHDVFQNIRVAVAAGAIGIYHHGSKTDRLWLGGQIERVKDYLSCIRDCGVQVGLGTHIPEVIEYSEEHGWDVDFYMACFYNMTNQHRRGAKGGGTRLIAGSEHLQETLYEEDPPRMCRTIRQTSKTCLAFKILAAGRLCKTQSSVRRAFQFAFENIKTQDAVVVGIFPKYLDQISLNVRYCRAILSA